MMSISRIIITGSFFPKAYDLLDLLDTRDGLHLVKQLLNVMTNLLAITVVSIFYW